MADRRANSVVFGFDFQVNAAIVLLLENITEMESVRLEGNYEDIEIGFSNGHHIFAQAKAITKASSDFKNVRAYLKKGLETLCEANKKSSQTADKLIFITNSPNPFNDDQSRSCFWGPAKRDYSTLPPSAQEIIDSYVSELKMQIDLSLLRIQVVPFETDDYAERYKAIKAEIDSFVGRLNLSLPGLSDKLMEFWHHCLMANGGTANAEIKLHKKDIVWPIIVLATDVEQHETNMRDFFDPAEYDEIIRNYRQVIDHKCERYDFVSRVLFDFHDYEYSGKASDKMKSFIKEYWNAYEAAIETGEIDPQIREKLIQIILYTVLRQRFQIEKIRKGVGL